MHQDQAVTKKFMPCLAHGLRLEADYFIRAHDLSRPVCHDPTVWRLLLYFKTPPLPPSDVSTKGIFTKLVSGRRSRPRARVKEKIWLREIHSASSPRVLALSGPLQNFERHCDLTSHTHLHTSTAFTACYATLPSTSDSTSHGLDNPSTCPHTQEWR
jgi:hypothetical protein